jgi:predicted metal-dependent hydrolase
LLDSVMHTMWRWHEDNEFDLDPMVCSAAIMVTAKMFNEHTMSFPEGGGMLQ